MRVRKECLKRDEYGGRHALPKLRTYPLLLEAGASASEEHSTPYHGFLHLHTPLSSSQLPLSPPQSKLLVQPAAASDNVSDGATAALTANPGPSTVVNAVSINVSHIGQPATNRTLKNYVIIFLFSYKTRPREAKWNLSSSSNINSSVSVQCTYGTTSDLDRCFEPQRLSVLKLRAVPLVLILG